MSETEEAGEMPAEDLERKSQKSIKKVLTKSDHLCYNGIIGKAHRPKYKKECGKVATISNHNKGEQEMRTAEYNKFKAHILEYMEAEDIREQIKQYKDHRNCSTTWEAGQQMAQDGCFACYYSQVLNELKDIYGEDYKAETYETKSGDLRWKNGEAYCWTIYKAKIALTIETMERKGDL